MDQALPCIGKCVPFWARQDIGRDRIPRLAQRLDFDIVELLKALS
jgi:hypothetical protein